MNSIFVNPLPLDKVGDWFLSLYFYLNLVQQCSMNVYPTNDDKQVNPPPLTNRFSYVMTSKMIFCRGRDNHAWKQSL